MPQTKHNLNKSTETETNFSITSADNIENLDVPEGYSAVVYRDSYLITCTTCDPDAIASFLGLANEGNLSPGIIFKLFNVPLTDLQALLLLGFLINLEHRDLTTEGLFSDWTKRTFNSQFDAGYNALSQLMHFHDLEMPHTLELLRKDSVAVQSALNQITGLMSRIDAPLNTAIESMRNLEAPEGHRFIIKINEEEHNDEEDVPF